MTTEEIKVCADCIMVIVNRDFSAMDDETAEIVEDSVDSLPSIAVPGDSDFSKEISTKPCGCCNSRHSGYRYPVTLIDP